MRIIAIIIPLMWGTVIFGHGKEKNEPKIIDDDKIDNTHEAALQYLHEIKDNFLN